MLKRAIVLVVTLCCFLHVHDADGFQVTETPNGTHSSTPPVGYINWRLKTIGGMQFWSDWRNVGGWRIQENSETGHFRLLDPNNVRHAWGDFNHCEQKLNSLISKGNVQPDAGQVVVLLHGLMRASHSFDTMELHLQEQGYATVNFCYASSRKDIVDHAEALKSVIDGLGPEVTDIHLVAHSLGNIVIRRYLFETARQADGVQGDPRIRRIVMLGPPNQGSKMARSLKDNLIFKAVAGSCGHELAGGWESLEPKLATPNVEFGIIAGGQVDDDAFSNPLVAGKDDFTVSVEETKLDGAADFLVRPLLHGTMMHQRLVLDATVRFFKQGYFLSAAERAPLDDSQSPAR